MKKLEAQGMQALVLDLPRIVGKLQGTDGEVTAEPHRLVDFLRLIAVHDTIDGFVHQDVGSSVLCFPIFKEPHQQGSFPCTERTTKDIERDRR